MRVRVSPDSLIFYLIKIFHVYILYNAVIDKYYIGSTTDLQKRLSEHQKGLHKSKYTRKQPGDWELVYSEEIVSQTEAKKRELQIKRWKSRKKVSELVEQSRP
ncbi:MAG: GIY-YIG nuclease family protein [Candidatus Dojkabacteria bacterium]